MGDGVKYSGWIKGTWPLGKKRISLQPERNNSHALKLSSSQRLKVTAGGTRQGIFQGRYSIFQAENQAFLKTFVMGYD